VSVAFDPLAIAADLSDCVCAALKDVGRGESAWVGECCVRPGSQVAWDSCCEGGGQAWVVLTSGFPTTSFPLLDSTSVETTCTSGLTSLGLNFEIGVLRCVNTEVDCDQFEADAANLFGDLQALLRGVNCCFSAAADSTDGELGWRLNSFEMLGPLGGCGGAKVNITVHTDYPCCP
jgi:hypothetical protein